MKAEPEDDSFLDIDEGALEKECAGQPRRFHKYATRLANARKMLAEAENELKVTKAELGNAMREDPGEYGLSKTTKDAVDDAILTHVSTCAAAEIVRRAQHRVDILQAAVTALDHRKRMLEMMVSLHGQDYFSVPRVKGTQALADEEQTKRVNKKIRKALNKD